MLIVVLYFEHYMKMRFTYHLHIAVSWVMCAAGADLAKISFPQLLSVPV
jgi:hypothetical protein